MAKTKSGNLGGARPGAGRKPLVMKGRAISVWLGDIDLETVEIGYQSRGRKSLERPRLAEQSLVSSHRSPV